MLAYILWSFIKNLIVGTDFQLKKFASKGRLFKTVTFKEVFIKTLYFSTRII